MEGVISMPKKITGRRKPMNAKIIQSGNSLALRVSSELATMYGLSRGMEVSIEPERSGFTVRRRDEGGELDRLVSLINGENRHVLEDWGAPEGREVW
jgi:antitoxin component of MazEF toxin-antitoxin module